MSELELLRNDENLLAEQPHSDRGTFAFSATRRRLLHGEPLQRYEVYFLISVLVCCLTL